MTDRYTETWTVTQTETEQQEHTYKDTEAETGRNKQADRDRHTQPQRQRDRGRDQSGNRVRDDHKQLAPSIAIRRGDAVPLSTPLSILNLFRILSPPLLPPPAIVDARMARIQQRR